MKKGEEALEKYEPAFDQVQRMQQICDDFITESQAMTDLNQLEGQSGLKTSNSIRLARLRLELRKISEALDKGDDESKKLSK